MTSLGCLASVVCYCNNNAAVPPCPTDVAVFCYSVVLLGSSLAQVISCRYMDPPPGSLSAWEGLATQACIQLLEVCTSHPNQKKVFTAVVTQHLLLLLSQVVWQTKSVSLPSRQTDTVELGSTAVPTPTTGRQSADQLAAVTKQLLKSVVFHNSSIEGLIELGNSFTSSAHGAQANMTSERGSTPRSYHSQLLQVPLLHVYIAAGLIA